MGESTQSGYSRPLMKSKTKPWPRHSTWKQITFHSHSPGNARDWTDSLGWQATEHRKQDGGALCIPSICQRMPLWRCKGWDKRVSANKLFLPPLSARRVGLPHWTIQRETRQSQIVFKHDFNILFCGYLTYLTLSRLSYHHPSDALGRFNQKLVFANTTVQ